MHSDIIEHRLSSVERAVEKIAEAMQEIARSTTHIAQLEARHTATKDGLDRAFAEITVLRDADAKIDCRMKQVEISMPGLMEIRTLVIRSMVGIISIVGTAMLAMVVVK